MSTNEQTFAGVKMFKLNSDDPNIERVLSIPLELLDKVRIREHETADARIRRLGLLG